MRGGGKKMLLTCCLLDGCDDIRTGLEYLTQRLNVELDTHSDSGGRWER